MHYGNLGKLGTSTPNYEQEYVEKDPKSAIPHFTSDEVLLKHKGHPRIELYLF